MLKHFTWQQFLVAAMIFSLVWYSVVIPLFYRDKIRAILDGKRKNSPVPEPLGHDWDEELEDEFPDGQEELMGKPAMPEGMSKVGMNMFGFAPRPDEDFEPPQTGDSRERQQSVIPDVLEELKSIFHILDKEQGTKEDFISLFTLVRAKYPDIRGSANQAALNGYIRENVLFPISDEELDSLWA